MYIVFVTLGLNYTSILSIIQIVRQTQATYSKIVKNKVICNVSDISGNKAPKFQILTLCFPTTKNMCIERFPRIRRSNFVSISLYFLPHLLYTDLCLINNNIYVDKRTLFTRFVEPGDEEKIMAEGVSKFCEDLNLDPTSIRVLLIAWKFKAATQCEFSKKEFIDGMTEIG